MDDDVISGGIAAGLGIAIAIGGSWFFITCTNNHFKTFPEQQQDYDLRYVRCKELCSGHGVLKFNLRECLCQVENENK